MQCAATVTAILVTCCATVAEAVNYGQFAKWSKIELAFPGPEFGIDESHRMYDNATYDFGSGASPYPYAGHGPYTHYVDNTHPNATNEDNPYGSPNKPRRDIFERWSRTLKAGSVVEIRGGPYDYTGWRKLVSEGTARRPVFLRAIGSDSGVRTQAGTDQHHDLRIEGSYLIVENQDYYDGAHFRIWPESHHIAIHDCEIHNPEDRWISTGSVLSIGKLCKHVVAYGNHIHHNRRLKKPPDMPEDLHGVTIGAAAQRVWVLGNHIHHNSGDAFQASHRAIPAPRFVYVGGKTFLMTPFYHGCVRGSSEVGGQVGYRFCHCRVRLSKFRRSA